MDQEDKINLTILATEVKAGFELLKKLDVKFDKHVEEHGQIILDVDRLKQAESRRMWHLRALWALISSSFIGYFFKG